MWVGRTRSSIKITAMKPILILSLCSAAVLCLGCGSGPKATKESSGTMLNTKLSPPPQATRVPGRGGPMGTMGGPGGMMGGPPGAMGGPPGMPGGMNGPR